MRQGLKNQFPRAPAFAEEQHSQELKTISDILDQHPEIAELAQQDLTRGRRSKKGRKGMSGEQAIRAALLKQIHALTYRELRFHLSDSATFKAFARLPFAKPIKLQTLQSNVKRLSAATWEALNRAMLKDAEGAAIELGRKTRTDCTVVESNVHEPTDSSLLWDCVRVITRIVGTAIESSPDEDWSFFHDRGRRAKRRAFEIQYPPKKGDKTKQREAAYRDLLAATEETYAYGVIAEAKIRSLKPGSIQEALKLDAWADELRAHLESTTQVITQTRRRVIDGEKVPAREKIFSIFEKHTDIIIKDQRDTFFGHKVCLTGGASSLILDCVIEDGNPSDSTLVKRSIERQKEIYGRAPRQVSFDGGFASKENLKTAKDLGVKDAAFHKKCGLEITDMVKSAWVFKRLRNFRAGIEGCISTLKRAFKMDRCTWRGLEGFKSYVWASVVSFNLIALARCLHT
jgi:IS5 family transposase